MRRAMVLRGRPDAQVAVYDALLFLMVTILVSTGMFLYSTKLTADGPGFTDTTYEDLARAQLNTVRQQDAPMELVITRTEGAEVVTESLRALYAPNSTQPTFEWMLTAACNLTQGEMLGGLSWDLSEVNGTLARAFELIALNGTAYAWQLLVNESQVMSGASTVGLSVPSGLPDQVWSYDLKFRTETIKVGGETKTFEYSIRYYLWPA